MAIVYLCGADYGHRPLQGRLCGVNQMVLTAFCWHVDDHLSGRPPPPEAPLWPSAGGTLGLVHARNGGGHRACSRCLTRDDHARWPR